MKKFTPISLLGLLLFACLNTQAQTAEQPNILLLIVDDLNDYVGWLEGHPQAETPNLDRLASKGTVFSNAWCNSPSCAPSRSSFMTGKHADYVNVLNNRSYKDSLEFRSFFTPATNNETVYTLPEMLKDSGGYFTYGFHKIYHGWTSGNYDNDFDETTTEPCLRSKSWNKFFDFRLGVDALPDEDSIAPWHEGVEGLEFGPYEDFKEPISNELKVADSVVQFFQDYANAPEDFCNKPFFAAFGALRPHTPYYAPERYFLDYYNSDIYQLPYEIPYNSPADLWPSNGVVMPARPGGGLTGLEGLGEIANWMATNRNSDEDAIIEYANDIVPLPIISTGLDTAAARDIVEEAKKAGAVLSYLACIKFVDEQIGKVLDALEENPTLAANTVVIMVSDHGYSMGERTHWHKFSLWDTDMRIPMIVYDPRTPVKQVSDRTVSLIDLFPTVLEIAGVAEPTFPDGSRYLDGNSIVPLLSDGKRPWNNPSLGMYLMPQQFPEGTCFTQQSVRGESFHYIRYRTNGAPDDACDFANSIIQEELYEVGHNREIDPEEWNNLADDPEYQNVKDFLGQWMSDGAFYNTPAPSVAIDILNLPCGLTLSDTIRLAASLYGTDGNPLSSPPPAWNYKWRIEPGGYIFTTETIEVTPADFSAFPGLTELRVSLQLINNTGAVSILDRKTIRLANAVTDLSFVGSLNGSAVEVSAVNYPTGAVMSTWDYGDGFVHEGITPLSHTYTMPGNYELLRTVYFEGANGTLCPSTKMVLITVPASAFDPAACLEVSAVSATDIGSAKVRLEWNPIYNASSYQIQYRKARETFTRPWNNRNSTSPNIVLKGLVEEELYDVRVNAVCPSETSVASFPYKVKTAPCDAPVNMLVNDTVVPGPVLSWEKGRGEINQFIFKVQELSTGIGRTKVLPSSVLSIPAYVLPNGSYGLLTSSGCLQFDGSLAQGKPAPIVYFTVGALSKNSLVQELDIFPNPATELLNVVFDMTSAEQGRILITDMKGASWIDQPIELQSGKNEIQLNTGTLPSGVYRVNVLSGNQKWNGKIVIVNKG